MSEINVSRAWMNEGAVKGFSCGVGILGTRPMEWVSHKRVGALQVELIFVCPYYGVYLPQTCECSELISCVFVIWSVPLTSTCASLNGARILCIYPMEHATYKYVTYLWEARSIRQAHKIIFPSSGLRPNMTLASLKLLKTNPCEDLEN